MVNLLKYETLLTLSAAIPNGSGRAVHFATFWSDDGLEFMFEPVGPDAGSQCACGVIPAEADERAMRESLDALVYDFIGALIWVHRPVFSWDDCYNFAVDLSAMSAVDALEDWRAPISMQMICDLTTQAVALLEVVAELLKPVDFDDYLSGDDAAVAIVPDPEWLASMPDDMARWVAMRDWDKNPYDVDVFDTSNMKPEDLWVDDAELSDDE